MSTDSTHAHSWFFACPQFIEPLLADELRALGARQTKVGHAGVRAVGDLRFGYNAMLWSRLASRATLQLASGSGKNQRELRTLLQTIPWHEHLSADGTLKVRFFGLNEDIRNTQFGAQWVKDQIGDYFLARTGVRPSVSNTPDVVVVVNLHKGNASIGLELNQQSLHQRGYHDPEMVLPFRENLAAAILIRSGWLTLLNSETTCLALLDPLCTSSTFLIEGALMAFDIAPGLLRGKTVADRWLGHDAKLWLALRDDARRRQQSALSRLERYRFYANSDPAALLTVRLDWQAAGLPTSVLHPYLLVERTKLPVTGLAITQLPYQRDKTAVMLRPDYTALGKQMADLPEGFRGALFADTDAPLALTGLFFSKEYRFLNGETEYKLYTFEKLTQSERPSTLASQDLANRIEKNLRKLKNFIKQGVSDAYRVYDMDIPEYAVAM